MSKETEFLRVIVDKVVNGARGPYAVARHVNLGVITFSLNKPVWEDEGTPERGIEVMLFDLRKKRAGWRAMRGRFVRPSDDQQPSNQ